MYHWRVKAVHDALAAQGKAHGALQVEDLVALGHLDQYHYLGVAACDEAAEILGLGPGSRVLDLGSGIGGPARYLAASSGCSVLGIEMQPELCEAASELTARVPGLAERVQFVCGDAGRSLPLPLPPPFLDGGFDHYLSQLVNLHVPDRATLLVEAFAQLREGGTFYIEDFCLLAPLRSDDQATLTEFVNAPSVSSVDDYIRDLEAVGFCDIEVVDMSAQWTAWNRARADGYEATKSAAVALHGREIYVSRQRFYSAVAGLFDGGRIGGVRVTGRKPGSLEVQLKAARKKAGKAGIAELNGNVRILESGRSFTQSAAAVETNPLTTPPTKSPMMTPPEPLTKAHAQRITDVATSQPPLPWTREARPGVHDSLQYHFFLPGLFLALYARRTHSPRSKQPGADTAITWVVHVPLPAHRPSPHPTVT